MKGQTLLYLRCRRHPKIAKNERVSGQARQQPADSAVAVSGNVSVGKVLRIDRVPWRFPQDIRGRAAEPKIDKMSATGEYRQLNHAVGEPVSSALFPLDRFTRESSHLDGEPSIDRERRAGNERGFGRD